GAVAADRGRAALGAVAFSGALRTDRPGRWQDDMTDVVLPQRGTPLFLASGSPRRAELLTQVGARFTRLPAPGVDETPFPDEPPEQYVIRLARAKAGAG